MGCEIYGEGVASWYHGTTAARNDCVWPWVACTPIRITALETGKVIVVEPAMYCDCYTGTANQRLVDLTLNQVYALGLDPARGLFRVRVEAASIETTGEAEMSVPDTAMEQP